MRNSITDIAGLKVGQAQDEGIRTGVTVLTAEAPFTAGVHVMGGAPGTRETDLLAPDRTVQQVDALVLSGGSAFGLDAASGVMEALREDGRGYPAGRWRVPIVPGAILFDLGSGGASDWARNPYRDLGYSAYRAAGAEIALGSHGAGTGASIAGLKGGIGTASCRLPSGHVVAALIAVNALGTATVGDSPHFWAAPWEVGGEFGGRGLPARFPDPHEIVTKAGLRGNTTIGIVATDAALDQSQCTRLATAAHAGLARALVPSHTPADGDALFAAATGARPMTSPEAGMMALCHAAAVVTTRAIARGIFHASPAPGDPFPCWQTLFG